MTDDRHAETGPLFAGDGAPDHGPNFWTELESALTNETTNETTDETAQLPAAAAGLHGVRSSHDRPSRRHRGFVPFAAPLAVAATLLLVIGLAVVVANRGGEPDATTEVVAGPTDVAATAEVAPLDGPEEETVVSVDPAATSVGAATPIPTASAADDDTAAVGVPAETGDSTSGAAGDPTPPAAPPIPDFAAADGAIGEPEFVPLDQGVPAHGTYLANWPERAVTFYAVNDLDRTCADAKHSEIRYVNGSGLTQEIRDPQLRFSGEISHFTIRAEQNLAAWVVGCGTQLELYVASLEPTGQVIDLTLAWIGEGETASALVLWTEDEVSLNAIEPGARAFAIEYNVDTGLLSRNGGPSRIMIEAGAPAERSLTPLAATSDGGLTYWAAKANPGTVSACDELYGSGQSDMLWLRQGEGQWQPAVAGDFPIGTVTAAAIEPEHLQFAFADVCAGESGRVVIGTQLPDGRIGDVQTLDLAPFVPGFAAQLYWIDSDTLRIETDNSEYGFGAYRYDYRLDEQIVVRLD